MVLYIWYCSLLFVNNQDYGLFIFCFDYLSVFVCFGLLHILSCYITLMIIDNIHLLTIRILIIMFYELDLAPNRK